MKAILIILLGIIPIVTKAQSSPFIDTINGQRVICFDPLDSKELIRWNEERIYSKDYVNDLINENAVQKQIIYDLSQTVKNDSIVYVNQIVVTTEVKKHYKALVKANSELNMEVNYWKDKNSYKKNTIFVLVVTNLITGLWLSLR